MHIVILYFCVYTFVIMENVLPICTWSPISNSDMVTDLPLSRVIFAVAGKHPLGGGGGGGGGGDVVVVVVVVVVVDVVVEVVVTYLVQHIGCKGL